MATGVMVFSFLGTTVGWKPADAAQAAADKVFGPWVNGLALAITSEVARQPAGSLVRVPRISVAGDSCGLQPLGLLVDMRFISHACVGHGIINKSGCMQCRDATAFTAQQQ